LLCIQEPHWHAKALGLIIYNLAVGNLKQSHANLMTKTVAADIAKKKATLRMLCAQFCMIDRRRICQMQLIFRNAAMLPSLLHFSRASVLRRHSPSLCLSAIIVTILCFAHVLRSSVRPSFRSAALPLHPFLLPALRLRSWIGSNRR
jgi:hypothetical protein